MPQIPQISDSASKSYSSTLTNNHGTASGGEQFTVDGANKPGQIQAASDKNTSNNPQTTMGQKDLIPLAVTISKNQTLAVETIKDIINADLLSTAKLNGYTELAGELENLNSSLYISTDQLLNEIIDQEEDINLRKQLIEEVKNIPSDADWNTVSSCFTTISSMTCSES